MELLDYFAGKALEGMIAHSRGDPPHGYIPREGSKHWHEAIAEEAFEIAVMMIDVRSSSPRCLAILEKRGRGRSEAG